MKIVILPSARDDLADGFQFYENQAAGLGGYFLESLFPISIRYFCMPECIGWSLVRTVCYPNDSHTQFITRRKRRRFSSKPFWTAAGTRRFIARGCGEQF